MDLSVIYKLAEQNVGMSTVDRLANIYQVLSSTLFHDVDGDVVELGANAGLTSVLLQMIIEEFRPTTRLYVFDSFEGMPEPGKHDLKALTGEPHLVKGDCAARKEQVLYNFRKYGQLPPVIVDGWFSATVPDKLPEKLAFAYLDSDFYESTLQSLEGVLPRMTPGGVILIDDYCDLVRAPLSWNGLPGVKRACDEILPRYNLKATALVGTSDLSFGLVRIPKDWPC